MYKLKFCLLGCFLILFVGFGNIFAQSNNASLSGTILDPQSALVAGANISAENTNTGIVTKTTSNADGVYTFPSLQPGLYKITVEAKGFQKIVADNVVLEIGARVSKDIAVGIDAGKTTVDVVSDTESILAQTTSSVGAVITAQRIKDLPLASTNAIDLVNTQAGVVGGNLAGGRVQGTNLSRDGVNIENQRFDFGIATPALYTSIDLIDEVRVITAPADAEYGRGVSQVQISTRSGTNEFHGSLYEANRNTALTANTFFNNASGLKRSILNRNQFGARIGGPIYFPRFGEGGPKIFNGKNKAFFFFLYEGQRQVAANTVNQTVLTSQARAGNFRFFPGVTNGNSIAAVPTVDANGNPVQPAAATGALQTVSLFGKDPNRLAADTSGLVTNLLGITPLPNNYRVGDGLNTAGYEFGAKSVTNRDQYNGRFDYYISPTNHLSLSLSKQKDPVPNAPVYPTAPAGHNNANIFYMSFGLTTSLTPTLLNDVRIGLNRQKNDIQGNYDGDGFEKVEGTAGGSRFLIIPSSFTNFFTQNNTAKNDNKYYTYGDTLTWVRGNHTFKGGGEFRITGSDSYNSAPVVSANVTLGANVAVTGISTITGIGGNATLAQNILTDLTGSVNNIAQGFNINSGSDTSFTRGIYNARDFHQKEASFFFKDDWRASQNLTLNLGVRYEYYGLPYEGKGRLLGLANSIFGLAGTSFADLFKPNSSPGQLTQIIPVGKNSANPSKQLYNRDLNNFGPAVGLSYSLPFLGKDKTIVRFGYSINYTRIASFFTLADVLSQAGGTSTTTLRPTTFVGLSNISSVMPLTTTATPFSIVPVTDRTQQVKAFDPNVGSPNIQSWSASLQRQLTSKITVEARYIGTKGTHLLRSFNLNEVNIFENGILNAFNITAAGGNSALLDQMFNGLTVNAGSNVALGQGVVGTGGLTASAALRANATTRGFFANDNPGGFAQFLNTTNLFGVGTSGGLIRRAGFAENFIAANPQFTSANGATNAGATYYQSAGNSTYHAMQLEINKRFSDGYTVLANYTWSKTLGEVDGQDFGFAPFRTIRNFGIDKQRLSYDRPHSFKLSGTAEVPFGPGKKFIKSKNPVLSRLVGDWQFGYIFNIVSGAPFSITSSSTTFNQVTGPAALTTALSSDAGSLVKVANGVVYFNGYTQVNDPQVANLTTLQGLQALSTLKAIKDPSGNIVFVNPAAGTLGGQGNFLSGPRQFNVDINLVKRIRLREKMNLELRIDALNITNTPMFGLPVTDINNVNFGRITTHAANAGNRVIVLNGRFSF